MKDLVLSCLTDVQSCRLSVLLDTSVRNRLFLIVLLVIPGGGSSLWVYKHWAWWIIDNLNLFLETQFHCYFLVNKIFVNFTRRKYCLNPYVICWICKFITKKKKSHSWKEQPCLLKGSSCGDWRRYQGLSGSILETDKFSPSPFGGEFTPKNLLVSIENGVGNRQSGKCSGLWKSTSCWQTAVLLV